MVPTADCPSDKLHRPDIQEEVVQQWQLVMYAKIIFRIKGLLNVSLTKNLLEVLRLLKDSARSIANATPLYG